MRNNHITVVMPTYNSQNYIRETLETVIQQTVLPEEILIIDDGSTDNTIDIIESLKTKYSMDIIRILTQKNSGPGAARNYGIKEAKHDWIAFLDSDDLWESRKIELVKKAILEYPDISIFSHDEYENQLDGTRIIKELHKYYDDSLPLFPQLYKGCFLSTSCMVVKKDLLLQCGGFDETLLSAQDYDLWLKLSMKNRMYFIPEILETYIIRGGSVSANYKRRYACMVKIFIRNTPYLTDYHTKMQAVRKSWRRSLAMSLSMGITCISSGKFIFGIKVILNIPYLFLKALFLIYSGRDKDGRIV